MITKPDWSALPRYLHPEIENPNIVHLEQIAEEQTTLGPIGFWRDDDGRLYEQELFVSGEWNHPTMLFSVDKLPEEAVEIPEDERSRMEFMEEFIIDRKEEVAA